MKRATLFLFLAIGCQPSTLERQSHVVDPTELAGVIDLVDRWNTKSTLPQLTPACVANLRAAKVSVAYTDEQRKNWCGNLEDVQGCIYVRDGRPLIVRWHKAKADRIMMHEGAHYLSWCEKRPMRLDYLHRDQKLWFFNAQALDMNPICFEQGASREYLASLPRRCSE